MSKYKKATERAIIWLETIRDDDRDGQHEIAYDQFAYERRESEFKEAAINALKDIDNIIKEKTKTTKSNKRVVN